MFSNALKRSFVHSCAAAAGWLTLMFPVGIRSDYISLCVYLIIRTYFGTVALALEGTQVSGRLNKSAITFLERGALKAKYLAHASSLTCSILLVPLGA